MTGCFRNAASGGSNNGENGKKNDNVVRIKIGDEEFKLDSKDNLYNMHYNENYVDFYTDAIGDVRIMQYSKKGEMVFQVRMAYDDNKGYDEIKNLISGYQGIKSINGIGYDYFDYITDDNYNAHVYSYYYNNASYVIMFISKIDMSNLEEVFMNNVYFE